MYTPCIYVDKRAVVVVKAYLMCTYSWSTCVLMLLLWYLSGTYFSDKYAISTTKSEHFVAQKSEQNLYGKCRDRQKAIFREHICGMPQLNKSGNAAKEFAAMPRKRTYAAMPHSSGTLRYYRANTCFCMLFSQALRTLYTSPPCDRQAFTSLTSSARQSSLVTVNLYFQLSTCCIISTSRSKSLSSSKHATTTPTD